MTQSNSRGFKNVLFLVSSPPKCTQLRLPKFVKPKPPILRFKKASRWSHFWGLKTLMPGDSSRYLFIPDRWRSQSLWSLTFHHPKKVTFAELPGGFIDFCFNQKRKRKSGAPKENDSQWKSSGKNLRVRSDLMFLWWKLSPHKEVVNIWTHHPSSGSYKVGPFYHLLPVITWGC